LFFTLFTYAQENAEYQKPPQEILELVKRVKNKAVMLKRYFMVLILLFKELSQMKNGRPLQDIAARTKKCFPKIENNFRPVSLNSATTHYCLHGYFQINFTLSI
jgi:hypothetical protein